MVRKMSSHRRPRLELAGGEVGRADREAEVVLELGRLLAVALAALAVALPAFGLAPHLLAASSDRLRRLAAASPM